MKRLITKRKLAIVVALCAITALAVTAYALTSVRLASGTILFSENFKGPADVAMSQVTMQPGDAIAWHYHPGRAYAIVKSGTVTEDHACGGSEVFTAGQAFEEPIPRVHQARNTGTVPAELFVTVIVPSGQPTRIDTGGPICVLLDDAQFFVRQHYADFLNRAPDAAGLTFWTNEITSCGTDQGCIEVKRTNVSAAFLLSIEFQNTGYLVERLYKASYGDATGTSTIGGAHQLAVPIVRLSEFLPDTQTIGQGVVVGQTGWETVLENNKQAFVAQFATRARFTTVFPNSMTAAQFVDTLNANAGNPLSTSERNQLVNDLAMSAKTRAQVLRAVAEDPDLNSAEFNRAFVLMHYFGYLRRNPNAAPDSDHSGYDFWLTKLNQLNGNFINAEMVKAFISSGEYRQRFGS